MTPARHAALSFDDGGAGRSAAAISPRRHHTADRDVPRAKAAMPVCHRLRL